MNAKISCIALKYCVSHGRGDGAEVFTTAMSKFYSGLGLIGSGACAVHESLSVCSLCSMWITDSKCKNMLNTFPVNHELLLEPLLQCVDTLGRFENKLI